MNNPYPSRQQLRTEAAAERLCTAQATATAAFQAIVITARTAIAALEFPLGSPARGYDREDIDGTLGDWLAPRSNDLLEAEAMEVAARDQAHVAADYADMRRPSGRGPVGMDVANDNFDDGPDPDDARGRACDHGWRGLAA